MTIHMEEEGRHMVVIIISTRYMMLLALRPLLHPGDCPHMTILITILTTILLLPQLPPHLCQVVIIAVALEEVV